MTTRTNTPAAPTWRDIADQLDDTQRAALAAVELRGIHTAERLLDLARDMAGDPANAVQSQPAAVLDLM